MNTRTFYKPMKKITLCASLVGFALVLFLRCSQKNMQTDYTIHSPFSKIKNESDQFIFDPQHAQTLNTKKGSTIIVPSNAFVYEDGSPVQEKVQLDFEEYHTLGEIMTSGIPMKYKNGTQEEDFQSAGMFKIEGKTTDGKQVFIAGEAELTVELVSYQEGDDYDFYSLNESEAQWTKLGKSKAYRDTTKLNELFTSSEHTSGTVMHDAFEGANELAIKPQQYKKGDEVIDLAIDLEENPELKVFSGAMWKFLKKKDGEKVLQKVWDGYEMKCIDEKNAIFKVTFYASTEVVEDQQYTTTMKPVFEGGSYKKAMKSYQSLLKKKEIAKAKELERQQLVYNQSKLMRSFAIQRFGIFNYDRFYKRQNITKLMANFTVDGKPIENSNDVIVFLIVKDQNTVIKYPKYAWGSFNYDAQAQNKLMVVMPNEQFATFSVEEFSKINHSEVEGQEYTFDLSTVKETPLTTASLDQLI